MTNYIDLDEAIFTLADWANQNIASQLKTLLEEKHLYQNFAIDFEKVKESLLGKLVTDDDKREFRQFAARWATNLIVSDKQPNLAQDRGSRYAPPTFLVQNVKMFCSSCKARETFRPTWFADVTTEVSKRHEQDHHIAPPSYRFQIFVISYQCEACRDVPVCILVKRENWKFTLEGRSPIEEVEVPKAIPKIETWLFSDAIVAYQAGKTLAGLFYLRSFIEQFARRQTGIEDKKNGDEILDAYQALLPDKQKELMPSLRSWYAKLSEPIHAAKSDETAFEQARVAIIKHFELRRLFEIPELVTAKADKEKAVK